MEEHISKAPVLMPVLSSALTGMEMALSADHSRSWGTVEAGTQSRLQKIYYQAGRWMLA